MRKLSLILGMLLAVSGLNAQDSPHGDDLKVDCLDCHSTEGWIFSASTAKFNHDQTTFRLEGEHQITDCKSCHTSLVFSQAKSNCVDCHTDMHNTTVGMDCARCHTPKSWLVTNITELHQNGRFPLLGAHNTADCSDCHTSVSNLEFQPLGVECIDCHRQDYQATTNPNHQQAGLSTDCMECHRIDAFLWTSQGFNHDFFPLTKGHELNNCAACHTNGVFEPVSTDCYSCHQNDFASATNPAHNNAGFTTQCTDCHTTDPDWKPAKFDIHDDYYFPIYSGKHREEWNSCADCHTQPASYAVFSCTDCHEHNKNSMDEEHSGISGYSYSSPACFACHPQGNKEGAFDHDATGFLLKGAHTMTDCLSCHTNGFSGTPNTCKSCHTNDYTQAADPNHVAAGVSQECETCHDENAWKPSLFNHTTVSGFELAGGHSGRQCSDCHTGNTSSATPDCFSCHQENYNNAPDHLTGIYPTDCLECHTVTNWEATAFNHDGQYFPIYSGRHAGQWNSCSDCHTQTGNFTVFSCITCHEHNQAETDSRHGAVNDYTYTAISCYTCHPNGFAGND